MTLLNYGLQGSSDTDPVATHNGRLLFTGFIQKQSAQSEAVLGAELENVAYFDGALHFQRFPAFSTRLSGPHAAQVGPLSDWNVTGNVYMAQMEAILIGTSGHARFSSQRFVRKHPLICHANGA